MTEPTERTETLDDRVAGESWLAADGAAPRRRRSSSAAPSANGSPPPTTDPATDPAPTQPHLAPAAHPVPGPPAAPAARPPRRLSGRYLLQERIANGGMASVWRARDEVLARTVAVKLLHDHLAADDDFRERFRREAISAAKLSHPAIVGLYDTGSDEGQVFLVMEFVDGATLRDVIARSDGLPPGHAAAIAERVARALDYAHERGLVHRDVKPANILIGHDGAVKVADFGIAKADQADDLTKTGMVLGTAAYVAPEQILAHPIDGAADQYALGCMLYEALTGRQPFKAETAVATAAQRLERPAPPLRAVRPDVPDGLERIVARAMSREPADRFPTAGRLADALAVHADADTARTAALVAPAPAQASGGPERRDGPAWAAGPATSEMGFHDLDAVTGATAAPPTRPPTTPAAPPRRRVRTAVWLAPLLLLLLGGGGALGAWATGLLDRTADEIPAETDAGPAAAIEVPPPTPEPAEPAPSAAPIALAASDLTVFDPLDPDGVGTEYDERLPRLVDDDPDTAWQTEGYDDPDLGKEGVGFVVDLGTATEVESVQLALDTPGIAVELRTAARRPTDPDDTRTVARLEDAPARALLEPPRPVETRFLVVWITGDLQPDESGGGGRNRAIISELDVRGRG